jgi:galactokinase
VGDVQKWQVREVVHLLGEQLAHCGAPALSVATGRTMTVKARPRDDDSVNVWVDGRRSPLPPDVAATLDDHGIASDSADIVIETEPSTAHDNQLVLMMVDTSGVTPPDRSGECHQAAEALGLKRLADAGPDAVLRLDDESLKARTRHVITETARVRAASRAIETESWAQLGSIISASHASLRDDFEVTCAQLDVAAEAALEAGALGARASGGSVIAIALPDRVAAVRALIEQRFDGAGWPPPAVVGTQATTWHL